MNLHHITATLAITAFTFSVGVMAENMSRSEYKLAGKRIVAEFKSNMKSCDTFAREYKNDCMTEAKHTARTAKTDLDASFRSTTRAKRESGVGRQKQITPSPNKSVMTLQSTSTYFV